MKKILFIIGTRPEAIKLAPLIKTFKKSKAFEVKVCLSSQHKEMVFKVFDFFRVKADYDLDIMESNQTLFTITSKLIKRIEEVLSSYKPDFIFVQGDTTTSFIGALAGFYNKIPVAHIEAGLRSFNKFSPFPEEMNRILTDHISDYHFAPTEKAKENLLNDGISDNIWVVGNTVVDALHLGLKIINKDKILKEKIESFFSNFLNFQEKKIILVTSHRRENFGRPFKNFCFALKKLADNFYDIEIVYPIHLNPNVREPAYKILSNHPRIHILEPLSYPYFIWLMNKSYLILTDSGGLQEEAPSLGKPLLIIRDTTERHEVVNSGIAKLVGTDTDKITNEASSLILNKKIYNKMAKKQDIYGDGKTSEKILSIMLDEIIKEKQIK